MESPVVSIGTGLVASLSWQVASWLAGWELSCSWQEVTWWYLHHSRKQWPSEMSYLHYHFILHAKSLKAIHLAYKTNPSAVLISCVLKGSASSAVLENSIVLARSVPPTTTRWRRRNSHTPSAGVSGGPLARHHSHSCSLHRTLCLPQELCPQLPSLHRCSVNKKTERFMLERRKRGDHWKH